MQGISKCVLMVLSNSIHSLVWISEQNHSQLRLWDCLEVAAHLLIHIWTVGCNQSAASTNWVKIQFQQTGESHDYGNS